MPPVQYRLRDKGQVLQKERVGDCFKDRREPFDPFPSVPHLPYRTSPGSVNTMDLAICPKGQAGLQTVYDPYRITKVLKRAGKRGEGKWITIPFDQGIEEIVNGGFLFKNVPGKKAGTWKD